MIELSSPGHFRQSLFIKSSLMGMVLFCRFFRGSTDGPISPGADASLSFSFRFLILNCWFYLYCIIFYIIIYILHNLPMSLDDKFTFILFFGDNCYYKNNNLCTLRCLKLVSCSFFITLVFYIFLVSSLFCFSVSHPNAPFC